MLEDFRMIGKSIEEIEKEKSFDWYVEFKPKEILGFDLEEHKRTSKATKQRRDNGVCRREFNS